MDQDSKLARNSEAGAPEVQVSDASRILSGATIKSRYRSKSDVVYEMLREAVLTGEIAPGQRIVVDGLATELAISKIPIREAISRLASEGLVEITPHVGTRVSAPPTVQDLVNIYAVRATLEEMATGLAAQNITDADLRRLREIMDEIRSRIATIDRNTWTRLNREFHSIIFAASGNRILAEFCEEILNRSARYRGAAMHLRSQAERLVREHYGLLEAIERRDAVAAAALARQHVDNSGVGVWRGVESLERNLVSLEREPERGDNR